MKKNTKKSFIIGTFVATFHLTLLGMEQPQTSSDLDEIIATCKGTLGIYAIHLDSGQEISVNAEEFFPMASTRKIMLAAYVFAWIDHEKLALDHIFRISLKDIVPGTGILKTIVTPEFDASCTVKQLIEYMICDSDNTAADILMKNMGGFKAIDSWLYNNAVTKIKFGTNIKDWLKKQALKSLPYHQGQQQILNSPQAPTLAWAAAKFCSWWPEPATIDFSTETTNIATPKAVTSFLADCFQENSKFIPNSTHQALLKEWMANCNLGKDRIPKYLPSCTVYHKTGSGIIGICNDAAIIESSDKKDRVALTIFIKNSVQPMEELEEIIARSAAVVYDQLTSPVLKFYEPPITNASDI